MSDVQQRIFEDIRNERAAQDLKWGKQMHPNGTSIRFKPMADAARNATRKADANNQQTWTNILREEFWEALSETDRAALRAELIQVGAVVVAWVECLDES
ncbi:hypothetical protein HOU95_gp096 [Streptomyces phage Hiyaa]|jgi:hypothetical protein|uniref:Uncharacterized protein n=1 Tax=Streptomyces phage Hiyaa TaxID=2499072 RepID=A0A3S9U8R0_9CAUD|nr:hypothetical protein HOU95_gp096 [Streptomyces phage Hiyaa]AZS06711.1 hypothetical protein SEA_HIYAA_72 [Streptomyces phage Hiyaa]